MSNLYWTETKKRGVWGVTFTSPKFGKSLQKTQRDEQKYASSESQMYLPSKLFQELIRVWGNGVELSGDRKILLSNHHGNRKQTSHKSNFLMYNCFLIGWWSCICNVIMKINNVTHFLDVFCIVKQASAEEENLSQFKR